MSWCHAGLHDCRVPRCRHGVEDGGRGCERNEALSGTVVRSVPGDEIDGHGHSAGVAFGHYIGGPDFDGVELGD